MKRRRGQRIFQEITTPLVHLVGDDPRARVELPDHKVSPDHVWISLDPGFSVRFMISVNTYSIRNGQAGFDPRVRLGIIRGTWEYLPERGVSEWHHFSYDEIPGIGEVDFRPLERVFLEQMLLDQVHHAMLLEAWGSPYQRQLPGIHQIHSRSASCAVPETAHGADGALRFYFHEERRMEMLLFKFCGQ
jgi:hypothetical protein